MIRKRCVREKKKLDIHFHLNAKCAQKRVEEKKTKRVYTAHSHEFIDVFGCFSWHDRLIYAI